MKNADEIISACAQLISTANCSRNKNAKDEITSSVAQLVHIANTCR